MRSLIVISCLVAVCLARPERSAAIQESLDIFPSIIDAAPSLANPDNIKPFSDRIFDSVRPLIPEQGREDFEHNEQLNTEFVDQIVGLLRQIPTMPRFRGVPSGIKVPDIAIPDIVVGA